jgi:hypothetical protein
MTDEWPGPVRYRIAGFGLALLMVAACVYLAFL